MSAIAFRRILAADLPLLRAWMARPHVSAWWGDPDDEIAGMRAMIEGRDGTEPYLLIIDGREAGYIEAWFIADQRTPEVLAEAPWVALLPDEAVGVDLFIGEEDLAGRGNGAAALRAFVAMLRARGMTTIVIDPDPDNIRALRCYKRAGFRTMPELLGKTGDSLLMRHHP